MVLSMVLTRSQGLCPSSPAHSPLTAPDNPSSGHPFSWTGNQGTVAAGQEHLVLHSGTSVPSQVASTSKMPKWG